MALYPDIKNELERSIRDKAIENTSKKKLPEYTPEVKSQQQRRNAHAHLVKTSSIKNEGHTIPQEAKRKNPSYENKKPQLSTKGYSITPKSHLDESW